MAEGFVTRQRQLPVASVGDGEVGMIASFRGDGFDFDVE